MVNFKDLFRFSQKEVSCLFENATIKFSWRGLKLLQAPLDCFSTLCSLGQTDNFDASKEFENKNKFGKLLIITPRGCGKANQRNLFRRRVKSIFYSNKLYLYPANSILIAYKNAMTHDFDHLQEFLIKNFTQSGLAQPGKATIPSNRSDIAANAQFKLQSNVQSNIKSIMPVKLWQRLFIATFDVIRPVFGFISGACIYPVSCSDYAKHTICTKPFYKSIPLIFLRVLSCNPITALFIRWKNSKHKK